MKARPFVTLYDYLVNLQPLYFSSVRYMFLCNQKFILMKDITNKFYYLLQKQKRYSVFCDILLIFQEFSFVTIYLKQSLLKNRQLYRLPNKQLFYILPCFLCRFCFCHYGGCLYLKIVWYEKYLS